MLPNLYDGLDVSRRPNNARFRFSQLRDLELFLYRSGWATKLRPSLSRPLMVTLTIHGANDARLVDLTLSDRLEAIGRTRGDSLTVVLPTGSTRVWLNGYKLLAGDALALPADYPLAAWSSDTAELQLLFVTVDALGSSDLFDSHALRLLQSGQPAHAEKTICAFKRLRDGDSLNWRGLSSAEKTSDVSYRVLKASVRFVDLNLGGPIRIPDVSAAAATSVSKLERVFRSEVGLSPSRYIQSRRLNGARIALQSSDSAETTVASVALDHGFSHLGRFAAAYRNHFGELPSETLKSPVF